MNFSPTSIPLRGNIWLLQAPSLHCPPHPLSFTTSHCTMPMALFLNPPTFFTSKPFTHKPQISPLFKKPSTLFLARSADDGVVVAAPAVEDKLEKKQQEPLVSNGAAAVPAEPPTFKDARWVAGTWDLKQFGDVGKTDWDAVIEAEARRRKWLEDTPESSNNENPVLFDTSIIPWWAWVKKYHLPEAELLNGRAAMIGFFMAYFVDSLTGVGLVDQMGNFFCKTLLFVAVVGVLVIRKNEDVETVKKLIEETTFYDKQWQATWKDDTTKDSKKDEITKDSKKE